jgi:hypothetical protein
MGSRVADMVRGDAKASPVMAAIGSEIINSFNPIGGESIETFLSPTLLDPVIELSMNKNLFGSKIRPENPTSSSRYRTARSTGSTPEVCKWLAQGINAMTGGNDWRKPTATTNR